MNKNKFTSFQFASLLCFPLLSLFSGISTYSLFRIAKVDSYLSPLIAGLLGIIILKIFTCIFNYLPDKKLPNKNIILFGKILGTIINYIICILFIIIGIVIIYNTSNFVVSQFLSETPLIVAMLLFSIILIYNVSHGIENISRVGIIFLGIIFILTLISTLGIIPTINTDNLKPTLEYGLDKPLIGAIYLVLTNITPIFALLIVEKNKLINNKKTTNYLYIFYIITISLIFITTFLTLSSLGIYLSLEYQYPEYTVLKKISFLNFVDRIENFIYIKWILSSLMYLSIIIYYISQVINNKSKFIVPTIITSIIIYLSLYLFKNNTIFYTFSFNIFPYICLLLLIIFLIITLNIFIRKIFNIKNTTY